MARSAVRAGLLLGLAAVPPALGLHSMAREDPVVPEISGLPTGAEMMKAIHDLEGCASDVCMSSCSKITKRGFNDPDKEWMLDTPIIENTLSALKRWPDERNMNRACAEAVGAIAVGDAELSSQLGDAGAVELINDMIRRYKDDKELLMGGISGCMMGFCRENRIRWAKDGGIELNMENMKRFYVEPGVVLQTAYAFTSGAQSPNEDLFAEKGVIEEMEKMFTDYRISFRVREEVMEATRHLAEHSWQLRERLVKANFIQGFVDVFASGPEDKHQLQLACINLKILAQNTTYRQYAARIGGPERAFGVIDREYHDDGLHPAITESGYTAKEDCLELAAMLAEEKRGKDALIEHKAVEKLTFILKRADVSARLRSTAENLLKTLQS